MYIEVRIAPLTLCQLYRNLYIYIYICVCVCVCVCVMCESESKCVCVYLFQLTSKMCHKIKFLAEFYRFEFRDFLLLDWLLY